MSTTKSAGTAKTAVKKSTNGWTEETTALAVKMYTDVLTATPSDETILAANDSENMLAIVEATKAKSIASVRSKLTSEKVYAKPSEPRKFGGGTSVRKVHFVRALADKALEDGVIESADEFDSLETAKASTLKALTDMLNITVKA